MTRNEVIQEIRVALKRRSGRAWSVTGGRGTGWGWITIDVPLKLRTWRYDNPNGGTNPEDYTTEVNDRAANCGHMGPSDRAALAKLLGLDHVHCQGVSIPAGSDYWEEYADRANGRTPTRIGQPYWD